MARQVIVPPAVQHWMNLSRLCCRDGRRRSYVIISPRVIALIGGGGGGSATRISSTTRPQDPGGGATQSTALREEATVCPRVQLGHRHQETVGVSAVLVEVTPERCAQIFPSVSDNLVGIAEGLQPENGSCSTRGLLWEAGSILQEGADLTKGVATVAPSPVILAAKISEDVALPTIAGAVPLANFAEVVAADNAALADAGIPFPADPAGSVALAVADLVVAGILFPADLAGSVTLAVADSADAGILFPADPAGILFPADPSGILFQADTAGILFPADTVRTDTADVACLADAEEVTVGVAELADSGILFPADPAGILFQADPAGILFPADPAGILFPAEPIKNVTANVAFLADADLVTMGVTDLADAGPVPRRLSFTPANTLSEVTFDPAARNFLTTCVRGTLR